MLDPIHMTDNRQKKVFYLLVLIIFFLGLISLVPEFSFSGYQFKRPSLLSDIKPDLKKKITSDSIKASLDSVIVVKPIRRIGTVNIEEFENENLKYFVSALRHSKTKPVRIAFFGDSFIEGDILCGPFRDTLQRLFGGSGVGYMPITSEVTKFRTTVQHDFLNWKTYSMVGQKSNHAPLGLSGYCFLPENENEVSYKAVKRNFIESKVFFESELPFSIAYTVNDSISSTQQLEPSQSIHEFRIPENNVSSIKFSFPRHDSLRVYGAAFEDSIGISVDNFSMRSNPGMGLFLVDQERLKQFNSLRDYKLIILQYGLNVLSEDDTTGYLWYGERMIGLVNRLKESFPESSFLLIGIGDRSSNQKGTFATMPGILQMRSVQRRIAQRTRIAFWDMYEAMGGENSMVKYSQSQPPLAAKDYTHLTFRGGRKIAKKLADALLNEKAKYDKRH